MKEIIKDWLQGDQNPVEGLALLMKYGKNKRMATNMARNPKRYKGKIARELSKLVGISLQDFQKGKYKTKETVTKKVASSSAEPVKKKDPEKNSTGTSSGSSGRGSKELPKNVRRVLHEISDLYKKRSEVFQDLKKIPPENTEKNMESRRAFIGLISMVDARLDQFHTAKKNYFDNKINPDEKELWPAENTPEERKKDSQVQLFKRMKNLQSSLAKDRNQLLYQRKTKGKEEKPMPAGPKRDEIEARIKEKEKELEDIKLKLNAD